MCHFFFTNDGSIKGFYYPKIPRGPQGIGSRLPDPRGMKNYNPRFPESPRNENRRGIGIPTSLGHFL